MAHAYRSSALPQAFGEARERWRWFAALGVIFVALGAIAVGNLSLATIATVYYVGALMVIAGAMQVAQAFGVRTWSGFVWWLLSGALYAAAGIVTFLNPLLASFVFTLALGLLTAASGISRIWLGFQATADHGRGWVIASGIVTTVAGLLFVMGWPADSAWLLGLVLSMDLIFQGCALLAFGLHLRRGASRRT